MKSLRYLTFLVLFSIAGSAFCADRMFTELTYKGFNTMRIAVKNADMAAKLNNEGPWTLLAPIDSAFRDLPKAELDALLADKVKLTALINRHLIKGKLTLEQLKAGKITSEAGTPIELKTVDGKVKIDAATVVKPDVETANGYIQGVDKLFLLP